MLLAAEWAEGQGGLACALIVDHGLRPASRAEAAQTATQLRGRGLTADILTLTAVGPGPHLAARARAARLAALENACQARGIVHLLLGHHARDQAETVLIRKRAGSGAAGLAGMAAVRESYTVRILRPLLDLPPDRLRATLAARGAAWVEDPSNTESTFERVRWRTWLQSHPNALTPVLAEAAVAAAQRRRDETALAQILAESVELSPLGFALLRTASLPPAALAALIRVVGGRAYPPHGPSVAPLAAALRPATLGGARLLSAGRLGPGWLLVRESLASPVPAAHGAWWDRFRMRGTPPPGAVLRALGDCPLTQVPRSLLPLAVRRTLPAVFDGTTLIGSNLPGLPPALIGRFCFDFLPPAPATSAPWAAPPGAA